MSSEETLVYVAGNPDLYPLEYYDVKTHTYQGSIPQMLSEFAEEYGYRIEYYRPQAEDLREELAQNQQVDIVSGVQDAEKYENIQGLLTLLEADEEGETVAYQIAVTDVAPESLWGDLQTFITQISQEEWNGSLIQASVQQLSNPKQETAIIGLSVLAGFLGIGLAVIAYYFRQRVLRENRILCQDAQTGLPNQEYLRQVFPRMIHKNNRILYYVLYFHVNMTHMERIGGQVNAEDFLQHIVRVLRERVSQRDVLVRESNGDFVVLMESQNLEHACEWGESALREIREFSYGGGKVRPSDTAVGIYPLQGGAPTLADILFQARQCAIEACDEATDLHVCDERERKEYAEERQIFADFERGLSREEFQPYLQPFVDAKTKCVVGGEMLIRWNHPQKGMISPNIFVPLLEQEDRIQMLDYYNLRQTCAFLARLGEGEKDKVFFISCNFSRKTFCQADFVERCQDIIAQYDFNRKNLVLEITESEQEKIKDQSQMFSNIQSMREQGCRVIFDDFGIGFSSFHDLQDYPMDGLKLDKILVQNMRTTQGKAILQSLIHTGHELGMTVLAEGVEESSQAETLKELGCDILQGFCFSPPLPATETRKMIQEGWKIKKGNRDDQ